MTDDLVSQLSIRNLEAEGQPRTPLRKFSGVLEKLETRQDTTYTKPRTLVKFLFTDVEVIESTEPYDFPIAEIEIAHSGKEKSRWGVMGGSLAKFLAATEDVKDAIGRRQEWTYTPGHLLYDGKQGKDTEQGAWEVTGMDGAVSDAPKKTAKDRVLEILEGKTLQQFNQAALADPLIRGDVNVQKAIMEKKLIPSLIEEGLVSADDDGVYSVKVG